jgi:hypothetical protein
MKPKIDRWSAGAAETQNGESRRLHSGDTPTPSGPSTITSPFSAVTLLVECRYIAHEP